MDILPVLLFLLGVGFLFLGWRWQNPPNEEALTALKGLAYLKREIIRVQGRVKDLESELLLLKETNSQNLEQCQVEVKVQETRGRKTGEPELRRLKVPNKSSLYVINAKDHKVGNSDVKACPRLSPKYQEVLKLAANGQRIPEIAQRLYLSQDAVRMVLHTQSNGR